MATIADNRETITMGEVTNVIVESVASDKLKHISNWAVTFFAAFAGALPVLTSIVGLLVACAIFYKTYQDIRINKITLAKEGQRKSDQGE